MWSTFQIRSESERQGYTDQMSQALIAIIGTATVAVALAVPAHAQRDCAAWNTSIFFRVAEVSDVTRCLQAGADPNARDESGSTPLHAAAMSATGEAVTALLEAGADPNAREVDGQTPLHWAAWSATGEAVTALLEAGAGPERAETNPEPPRCMRRRGPRLVKP